MGLNTQGVLLISKHSFTLEEVQFLSAMLNSKFKLNTVAELLKLGQWNVRILRREVPIVRFLVSEHMHPSMMYKVWDVVYKDTRKRSRKRAKP